MPMSDLLGSIVVTSEGILTRYFVVGQNISQGGLARVMSLCKQDNIQLLPHTKEKGVYCLDPAKLREFEKRLLVPAEKEDTAVFTTKEDQPGINLHLEETSIPHPLKVIADNNDTLHVRRYGDLQINTWKNEKSTADTLGKMNQICWDLKTAMPIAWDSKNTRAHPIFNFESSYGDCHIIQLGKYPNKDMQIFVNYCSSYGISFKKCRLHNPKTNQEDVYLMTTDTAQVSKLYDELQLNLKGISPLVQAYRCRHGFQEMKFPKGSLAITSEGVMTRAFDVGSSQCSSQEFDYLKEQLNKNAGVSFLRSQSHPNRYYVNPAQLTKFENYVGEKDSYTMLLSVFDSYNVPDGYPSLVRIDPKQHPNDLMKTFAYYCKKNGLNLYQQGDYIVTNEREKFEQLRQQVADQSYGKGVLKGQFAALSTAKKSIWSAFSSAR